MSSLNYLDLCRLCLVKERVTVPIFEGEGDTRQIYLKITACLPVKVDREDKLPKKICNDCVYKVEFIYDFWNTSASSQKKFLEWLGEDGLEDKPNYATNVLNQNIMKSDPNGGNRLDGSMMQQVSEHQNNISMGMMDNINLSIPMIMSSTNQQQITSVPMDTSVSSVQSVQEIPGTSTQSTHEQITQSQTNTSNQQEEEEESSEEEENSEDECDGDEGLPVKEENEEDPNNSRVIEPTTFVNVSLACDEAGPSGLQQQKVAEIPEMAMQQNAEGDPKSGFAVQDPLEQNYLLIHRTDDYYAMPITMNNSLSIDGQKMNSEKAVMEIKVEPADECIISDVPDPLITTKHLEQSKTNVTDVFICYVCKKFFDTNLDLQFHLMDHNETHDDENFYKCSKCNILWKNKKSSKLHMKKNGSKSETRYCKNCEFKSTRKKNVTRTIFKISRFCCPQCSKLYNHKKDLIRHFRKKHYQIDTILPEDTLVRDEVVVRFCCPYCPKKYNFKGDVKKHIDVKHIYQKYMEDIFYSMDNIDKNSKLITNSLPIGRKHKILRANKRDKSIYNHKCPHCKWSFKSASALEKHKLRHSLNFSCDICQAKFKYQGPFLKHKALHEI